MKGLTFFSSERLLMRPMEERDADFVVALRSDPENCRWFLNREAVTKEGHLAWFNGVYLHDSKREEYVVEANGAPLGVVSGQDIRDGEEAEVGYVFSGQARGKGYATEAVGALMGHLKESRGIVAARAEVAAGNAPSLRLLERLGFEAAGAGPEGFLIFRKSLEPER